MDDKKRINRKKERRKKTNALLFTSIFLVIIVAFTSLFFFTDIFDNVIKSEPKVTTEVNSQQIENGITLETETKESKTYTSYIAYPLTGKENIDVITHDWIREQEDAFYEEMEQTEILLGEDVQAHFSVRTDVHALNDKIMSFKMDLEQSVEAENEYASTNTFVVDIEKDQPIELTDLLKQEEIEKDGLYLIIKDALETAEDIDTHLLKEYLSDSDNIKWTLHEDHISVYFEENEISTAHEAFSVDLALLTIYKLATEGPYQNLVITDEVQAEIDRIAAEEEAEKLRQEELKTNGKYVALTFDDGPSDSVTPRVLDTLKEYNAKATFYMLGQNAAHFPELAKRVADEGHEIANHSISHANLKAIGPEAIKNEMIDSMDQIEQATGVRPETFRPPYGNYNQTVIDTAVDSDQAIIMWSVDTLDWQSRNANAILEKVKYNTRSGSIVLMHDIHATTADALPQIMEYLSNEGYEFVTVSELMPLLDEDGIGPYFGK